MEYVLSTFDWCLSGKHDQCKRSYQRFTIDPRTNGVVWLDETVECQCKKRGCECYTKPADRPKKKTTKPRRRKS